MEREESVQRRNINKGWEGPNDGDLQQVIGDSRGVETLYLSTHPNNIDNNKITHRGVQVLAGNQWDNLTILDLGNP